MSFKQSHLRLHAHGTAPDRRPSRLAGAFSSPDARTVRRRMRGWLKLNGLTIVLVFAMMIFAWTIANH